MTNILRGLVPRYVNVVCVAGDEMRHGGVLSRFFGRVCGLDNGVLIIVRE